MVKGMALQPKVFKKRQIVTVSLCVDPKKHVCEWFEKDCNPSGDSKMSKLFPLFDVMVARGNDTDQFACGGQMAVRQAIGKDCHPR